ncbi:hypothetical protein LINGRAHAP2_LOCUS5206 [Linum grandiflorum]
MFDMEPDKATGPDGFNPGFYQRMWNDIGADVTMECLSWLMELASRQIFRKRQLFSCLRYCT